jgi:hypothetical protein
MYLQNLDIYDWLKSPLYSCLTGRITHGVPGEFVCLKQKHNENRGFGIVVGLTITNGPNGFCGVERSIHVLWSKESSSA